MFCTKCGANVGEGTKFCTRCGASVAGTQAAGNQAMGNPAMGNPAMGNPTMGNQMAGFQTAGNVPVQNPTMYQMGGKQKGKLGNKKFFIAGAVAVVAVLFLLLRGGGSGFSSPEKAYNAWMKGFCQNKLDLRFKAEPDFFIKYMGGKAGWKEKIQSAYDSDIAPRVAEGYSFVFEATGHTKLSKDEVKELEQRLENMYDADVKLSAAATIEQQLVDLTDGKKEASPAGTTGYAFKYKGKWYYLNIGL